MQATAPVSDPQPLLTDVVRIHLVECCGTIANMDIKQYLASLIFSDVCAQKAKTVQKLDGSCHFSSSEHSHTRKAFTLIIVLRETTHKFLMSITNVKQV